MGEDGGRWGRKEKEGGMGGWERRSRRWGRKDGKGGGDGGGSNMGEKS